MSASPQVSGHVWRRASKGNATSDFAVAVGRLRLIDGTERRFVVQLL